VLPVVKLVFCCVVVLVGGVVGALEDAFDPQLDGDGFGAVLKQVLVVATHGGDECLAYAVGFP
jgi:hypothetical protein